MIAASLTLGITLGLATSAQTPDLPAGTPHYRVEDLHYRVEDLRLYEQMIRTEGKIVEAAYCDGATSDTGDQAADRASLASHHRYGARTIRLRDRLVASFGIDMVHEAEDFIAFGVRCPASHNQIYWHRRYERELSDLERRQGL